MNAVEKMARAIKLADCDCFPTLDFKQDEYCLKLAQAALDALDAETLAALLRERTSSDLPPVTADELESLRKRHEDKMAAWLRSRNYFVAPILPIEELKPEHNEVLAYRKDMEASYVIEYHHLLEEWTYEDGQKLEPKKHFDVFFSLSTLTKEGE